MDNLQTHFANLCDTLRGSGQLTAAELSTGMLCICCLQLASGKEIELATLFLDKGADSHNPVLFSGAIMYNQLDLLVLLCKRGGGAKITSEDIMSHTEIQTYRPETCTGTLWIHTRREEVYNGVSATILISQIHKIFELYTNSSFRTESSNCQ